MMALIQLYLNRSPQISIIKLCEGLYGAQLERRMCALMSYWELADGLDKRLCEPFTH